MDNKTTKIKRVENDPCIPRPNLIQLTLDDACPFADYVLVDVVKIDEHGNEHIGRMPVEWSDLFQHHFLAYFNK